MKRIISYVVCAMIATSSIILTIVLREFGWTVSLFMLIPALVLPVVLSVPGGIFALLFCASSLVLMLPLSRSESLPVILVSLFCGYISIVNGFVIHWEKTSRSLKNELKQCGIIESKTGTYSDSYIVDILTRMMKAADRYNDSLTVCVIGLDKLKNIKFKYNRNSVDMYIKICIESVRKYIRNTDIIGRIGEDLFLILFDHSPVNEIRLTLERVRSLLADQEFQDEKTEISFGLCNYSSDNILSAEELIEQARKEMEEERKLKPEPLE